MYISSWVTETDLSQPSAVAVLEKATENQPTKIYFNITKLYVLKTNEQTGAI